MLLHKLRYEVLKLPARTADEWLTLRAAERRDRRDDKEHNWEPFGGDTYGVWVRRIVEVEDTPEE